jgi:hypothetical protein
MIHIKDHQNYGFILLKHKFGITLVFDFLNIIILKYLF